MSITTPSLLQHYETIAEITHTMLSRAQVNEWEEVLNLSEHYIAAVDQLRTLNASSTADRLARRQLLSQILEDDAKIRHLAMPELSRLNSLLGNMKRQQDVLQTYCSPAVNQA